MGTKRIERKFRRGDIIDREEYHDGRYGAPGEKRRKKIKPTKEQMILVNAQNKAKRCRWRLLEYFNVGDYFVTWTYRQEARPPDMETALKHFQKSKRKVKEKYYKAGYELFWIRNIEQGTRGAWHIHLVVNRIPGTVDILEEAWPHGGTYSVQIKKSRFYDEDFTSLANYMTKNENTREKKSDGTLGKPKIKNASYNTSRNMPLPKPDAKKLVRWKREIKPKKGYYIAKIYEGINPVTGYKYRRYTMIRINRRI